MLFNLVTPEEGCDEPGYLPCRANRDSIQCIPKKWFCDGRKDCPNGHDEACCGSKFYHYVGELATLR